MKPKREKEKTAARILRRKGLSTYAISSKLNINQSSVKRWVKDVELSFEQKKKLGMIPRVRAKNCLACDALIPTTKDSRQKFCDHSCAATYNNSLSPKRIKEISRCPSCSKEKCKVSKRCRECQLREDFDARALQPVRDFIRGSKYAAIKFVQVRKNARDTLKKLDREKKCEECGFDLYVEVCHLRPIPSFPLDTPLGVVNSPDNLKYLCPNHHAILDKELLY